MSFISWMHSKYAISGAYPGLDEGFESRLHEV